MAATATKPHAGAKGPRKTKPRRRRDRAVKPEEVEAAIQGGAKCGAARRKGGPCTKPAGWGTSHAGIGKCKLHGGSTEAHVVRAQEVRAAAAVELYGLPRDLHPMEALLEELARCAGHVDWLRIKLGTFNEEELVGPVGVEGQDAESTLQHHPRSEPLIWLRMYNEERERLVKVAKTCLDAGIDERKVRMAEAQGRVIATALDAILSELGVDPAQARPVVAKHLRELASTQSVPLAAPAREVS